MPRKTKEQTLDNDPSKIVNCYEHIPSEFLDKKLPNVDQHSLPARRAKPNILPILPKLEKPEQSQPVSRKSRLRTVSAGKP